MKTPTAPAVLLILAGLVTGGSPVCSRAQDTSGPEVPAAAGFRVVIDAPQPYRRLLEGGLDLVRWQADERMTPDLLKRLVAEARAAIIEAMAAEGHFTPEVRATLSAADAAPAVVRIEVEPGPRTRISRVDLRFQGAIEADTPDERVRREKLRAGWALPPGAAFRQVDWDAAKRETLTALLAGRYAAARVADSAARIDPDTRTAALEVVFDSGPVFHAGPVRMTGLKRYPASIVEHLNPLTPGAPYDEDSLILYQRRLLQTGYFSAVHLAVDPDPAYAAAAPLVVNVIEARSQRIDTGVSFSTDTRLRLQLDYSNNDVFDSAHRLRAQLQADARTQTAELTVDTPPGPGGVWHSATTRLRATDIQGERTKEAMAGVARNWGVWSTPSQLGVSAHLEEKDIEGSSGETVHAVFLGYRATFRRTDELLQPRRGLLGTFQLGTSLPGLATRQFVRATTRTTFLWPLSRSGDLSLRADLGAVFAESRFGIPSSFLFRTGGDQSVRGYAFESLGVRQGSAIVGGRYLAAASVEYTHWIAADWGAAIFADAGDAFDEPSSFRAARGYGIGARWRSPIGPFRADLAYGERTRDVRLHFSVGFSF